jgi:hypothetical protein
VCVPALLFQSEQQNQSLRQKLAQTQATATQQQEEMRALKQQAQTDRERLKEVRRAGRQ